MVVLINYGSDYRIRHVRKQMAVAMKSDATDWENLYYGAEGGKNVLLLGFRRDSLRKYIGKTVADVAALWGKSEEETAMDLIVQDSSRVDVAYFLMSEENVKKQMKLSYMSFGSDAGSMSPEGVTFLNSSTHPRAYGNFVTSTGQIQQG
jgi:N-acyl-D-amino-acid deacylase